MPGAPDSAKMGDARSLSKGGTSAVSSSTPVPLIIGGICVAAAVIVAIVVFTRDKAKQEIEDTPANEAGEVAGKATADGAYDAGTDDDDELSPARGSEQSAGRTEALGALADDLKQARLWSDVVVDRLDTNRIVVRTQYCEDDRLRTAVDDAKAALTAAGFTALQCFEQHGALVFEESF